METEDPEGSQETGIGGHQGTGGPGMETEERHLMGQGTPAQVARIDTATITLYITTKTAQGVKRKMKVKCFFQEFLSKTW